ncbi:conserved hypothetical protein [Ricinus communis]|uniref:Wound-responsive family protein n=1 Tax=Ricinus communis TaxID=3988 RepID=B9SIF1_RICCO|nr:conserved hypothetical protein [Ricinus communis]
MNVTSGVWIVAASIGTVEVMKDQGICRWNSVLRSLEQHAKNNLRTLAQPFRILSSSSYLSCSSMANEINIGDVKLKKQEESLEKILHLGCLGPNTIRF